MARDAMKRARESVIGEDVTMVKEEDNSLSSSNNSNSSSSSSNRVVGVEHINSSTGTRCLSPTLVPSASVLSVWKDGTFLYRMQGDCHPCP